MKVFTNTIIIKFITLVNNNKKQIAFTLAEVLITLLIIGVVGSLTIPALIQNTQDAELIIAWKKSYSDIDQATKRILLDNGGSLIGLFNDSYSMRNMYSHYLNFTKSCDSASRDGCWTEGNKYYNLNGLPWDERNVPALALSNGSFLYFEFNYADCDQLGWGLKRCGAIGVDINGFKKPNTFGKDIFYIHILRNGIKPLGIPEDTSDHCSSAYTGLYCGLSCGANYLIQ